MDQEPKAPEPGDVYVFPVEGAGTGICRVLARDGSESFGRDTFEAFTVELAVWQGARTPSLDEALAVEAQRMTFYRALGGLEQSALFRASGEVPESFTWIGRFQVPSPPRPSLGPAVLDWAFLGDRIASEVEYRQRPEGFAKAWDARQRDIERRARELGRRRRARGSAGKAPQLNWQPGVPPEAIAAGTRLLETFHADLGRARSARAKAKAVRACVEGFNRLDETSAGAIDTVVAGELFEHLVEAGTAAGLEEVEQLVEEVREF